MNNYEALKQDIIKSYEEGTGLDEAEKLAGKFLAAQLDVANALQVADLDARMRKSGLKAIKAAVYLDEAGKTDRKPTEAALTAKIDTNELVLAEQKSFDTAEVHKGLLEHYLTIFREAHIFMRGVSRGRFE